jgi:hypothetical protein
MYNGRTEVLASLDQKYWYISGAYSVAQSGSSVPRLLMLSTSLANGGNRTGAMTRYPDCVLIVLHIVVGVDGVVVHIFCVPNEIENRLYKRREMERDGEDSC